MKTLLKCLTISYFLFSAVLPLGAAWHNTPVGYPEYYSIVSDSSGQRLWFESYEAGIWVSTNSGGDWIPTSTRFRPEGKVSISVQIVDRRADTLVGTRYDRRGTVLDNILSLDGGLTWQSLPPPPTNSRINLRNSNPHEWFCYSSSSLYRSTDGGQTWPDSVALPYHTSQIIQDPVCDNCLFAAGESRQYSWIHLLYLSSDRGVTWTAVFEPQSNYPMNYYGNVSRLSNGVVFFATQGGFQISDDNGQTWHQWDAVPISEYQNWIAEDPSLPGHLYLVCRDQPGGLLRSWDYGRTWYPCQDLPEIAVNGSMFYQNPYSLDLYVGSPECGLYRSTNHGDSWQQVNLPPIGCPKGGFSITPEAAFFKYTTDYNTQAWQWESSSNQWQPLTLPRLRSDSLWRSPSPVFFKHGDSLVSLVRESQERDSVVSYFIRQALSVDNGNTWTLGPPRAGMFWGSSALSYYENASIRRLLQNKRMSDLDDVDTLLISTDLGQSWRALWAPSANQYPYIYSASQSDSNICIMTGWGDPSGEAIYLSNNAGTTWRLLRGNGDYRSQPVLLGNRVYVASGSDWICWNGSQWQVLGQLPPQDDAYRYITITAVETAAQTTFVLLQIGNDSTAFVSFDLGHTWQMRQFEFPFAEQNMTLAAFSWDPYLNRLWASTGVGVCYLDGSELSSGDEPLHFKPADFTVLAAYPNPFNGSTRIRYDLDRQAKMQLQIFDLQGRLVTTLLDDITEPGRHELLWNADNLSSGTYFVRLQTPQSTRTQKLLLLK
jgi:photosystem II stability/assembly factor-like uncharacterized protein